MRKDYWRGRGVEDEGGGVAVRRCRDRIWAWCCVTLLANSRARGEYELVDVGDLAWADDVMSTLGFTKRGPCRLDFGVQDTVGDSPAYLQAAAPCGRPGAVGEVLRYGCSADLGAEDVVGPAVCVDGAGDT